MRTRSSRSQSRLRWVGTRLFFILALVASCSTAWAAGRRCDNCSEAQRRERARLAGAGEHVVFSFSEGTAHQYVVDIEPGMLVVSEVPTDPQMAAAAAGLNEIFNASYGTMSTQASIPGGDVAPGGTNAFDVIQNINLRGQIADRLVDPSQPLPGVSANVNALRAVVHNIMGLTDTVQMVMVVVFEDGSSVKYDANLITQLVTYIEGSGRTADGQVIPESATLSDAGTWTGSPETLTQLLNHMRNRGADSAWAGDCAVGVSPHMVCVWDSPRNELTCRIYYACQ